MALATDAPVISPHPAHLAAEPYRASDLVRWHETDLPTGADDVRCRERTESRRGPVKPTLTIRSGYWLVRQSLIR
jgi:hypothetical protein